MSASLYLDMLDELLRPGTAGLSQAFVDAQVGFVVDCQQANCGFRGRQGDSDFYYTDFAVRTLAALAPEHAAFSRAASYVAHPPRAPRGTIECFNVLNSRRLLAGPLGSHRPRSPHTRVSQTTRSTRRHCSINSASAYCQAAVSRDRPATNAPALTTRFLVRCVSKCWESTCRRLTTRSPPSTPCNSLTGALWNWPAKPPPRPARPRRRWLFS